MPELDEHQQRVVDHEGGPLLVLAGPGTGKTTTLVEAIVDRIERRGASPDAVLALTFSRKAAEQLRDRVTARRRPHHLGRRPARPSTPSPTRWCASTPPPSSTKAPIRLLSAPEADVVLRELLRDNPESVVWPEQLRRAVGTRGFVREVQAVLARAREKGLDPARPARLGDEHDLPELRRRRALPRAVPHGPRQPRRHRLLRPHPPGGHRGRDPPRRAARALEPRLRRRVPGHRPRPGRPAARARRRRPQPHRRRRPPPVDLRLPRRRRARHPRLPGELPDGRRARRPRSWCCDAPAGSVRGCCWRAGRVAASPAR